MILKELNISRGSTHKEMVLRGRCSNLDKKMFQYAYDPGKMYYQKFSDEGIDWDFMEEPYADMFHVLDRLITRDVTGNAARQLVERYAADHGDLIKLICNKDLDCGVNETTLNKVFGKGFIPTFDVQLATDVPIEKVRMPCVAQLKYNGTRVIALLDSSGSSRLFTRNGKEFKYPKLQHELERSEHCNYMIDGELCFGDSQGQDHTKVSGIVNSAIKGTPIPSSHDLNYHVFDAMFGTEFSSQSCRIVYGDRIRMVKDFVHVSASCMVHVARTYELNTHFELRALFEARLAEGYEGLILKHWDHRYEFKRSKVWIKLKAEETVDLKCIAVEPGTGKYQGKIGALYCVGRAHGKDVEVKVGSGLSDFDRSRPDDIYLSNTIEVKYNTVIQDKATGSWSLFLPVFIVVRMDK